jgi:gliding motility-associated-like protein
MVVLVLFYLIFSNISVKAEGTKEIMPYDTCLSRLNLEPTFTQFAFYGCQPAQRLNIHIKTAGEKIYYGFGKVFSANQVQSYDLYYRIKDPNGNIVVNQSSIPTSGTGYITSYTKAVAGPSTVNPNGYTPLSYTTTTTGDYYIEFYYANNQLMGSRREIQYFDITVVSATNQIQKGRLWSREWQFTVTASPQPNPYDNPFYGKLYIYSDDSIVTSVNFNGMKPYVFAMSANSTGTANTGNPLQDRKSKQGMHTYPQYKIFLNDPDTTVYPSGNLGGFISPMTFSGCPGNHCITVNTAKAGAVQLLIDLNGVPGYQAGTADILIVQNVNAGTTCIPWNGLNGLGAPVANGTTVKFVATFAGGLTHMPIYDAESNPNGFKINLVRPAGPNTSFNLYWDDSNFPNYTNPPSSGCVSTTGCHVFPLMFGDQRTVNTWWYAVGNAKDSLTISYARIKIDSLNVTNASCPNINNGSVHIYSTGGTPPVTYSLNAGTNQTSPVFSNLSVGTYSVIAMDSNNCSDTANFQITSSPAVNATISSTPDTCNGNKGSISISVTSGTGPFQYLWNTSPPSTATTLSNMSQGVYTISITDHYNCIFTFTDTIINIPSNIVVTPTILHDTCANNMGMIILNVSNAVTPVTYSWNTVPPQNTATATNLGAGIYSVTITENSNCITHGSYTIQNMPPPSPDFLLPPKACVGDSVILTYTGNQTPPDNYNWNFNGITPVSGSNTGPYVFLFGQTGLYTISLSVNKTGCPSSSMTDTIRLFQINTTISGFSDVKCFGGNDGQLSIIPSGGVAPYSYSWNQAGITGSSASNLTAGNYKITVTDSIGCKSIVDTTIHQPPKLTIQHTKTDATCSYSCNGSIISNPAGGTQPYNYLWKPLMTTTKDVSNLCTGNYLLKVTDSHGCSDSTQISIGYSTKIKADFTWYFSQEYENRNTAFFTFTGYGASTFKWDFGDNSGSTLRDPVHYYTLDTNYLVELIANSGSPDYCLDTALKPIKVLPPFNVFVPTAFTPNGDGINDRLKIVATRVKDYHLFLYNRWGQLVFESKALDNMWDGRFKGKESQTGVYSYIIFITAENGKHYRKTGTVTLFR